MKKATFTTEEFMVMVALTADLNPADYRHPSARSVIEKCKSIQEFSHEGETLQFRLIQ